MDEKAKGISEDWLAVAIGLLIFLLALAANGLRHLSGRRDPITVTGHFLAPGKPGPAMVRGEVIKHGKRVR